MTTILGLDISSSCIGWGVLETSKDKSIKYIDSGTIIPKKIEKKRKLTVYETLDMVKAEISKLVDKYNPDDVAIEDIILFIRRKSTANTVITLGVYNRFVGHVIYEKTKKSPLLYAVMTIRHKIKLTKKPPKKEQIPAVLEKRLNIKFPYKYDTKKRIHIQSYDRSDGLAVALAHAMMITKL